PGAGRMATHVAAPIETPFCAADIVEGERVRAIPVTPRPSPRGVAFLDAIQRYSLDGWVNVTPVIRAHVSAAVLIRDEGELRTVAQRREHFVVVPFARLSESRRRDLKPPDGELYDSEA